MGVHFSGYANSTKFTDCCETAICDNEKECSVCGIEIDGNSRSRNDEAMRKLYGAKELAVMRKNY